VAFRPLPSWMVNGGAVTLGLILVQYSIDALAGPAAAQSAISTAVCASLADVVTTTDRVARRVGAAALASTISATVYFALRPYGIAWSIPVVVVLVTAAMLLLSWGPKAAPVAFGANLALVFAMSIPPPSSLPWDRIGWGLIGSVGYLIWATITARLLQPTWRTLALMNVAEATATLFGAIGAQLAEPSDPTHQHMIVDAEATLAEHLQNARDLVFSASDSPRAVVETTLLLHLIDLRDLAIASNLDAAELHVRPTAQGRAKIVAQIMDGFRDALQVVARHLRTRDQPAVDADVERSIDRLMNQLQCSGPTIAGASVLGTSDLLARKLVLLRTIQRLAANDRAAEPPTYRHIDLQRYVAPDEWKAAAIRANLRLDAPVFRHALRTGITAAVAYAFALPLLRHPQWALLTVVAVMQGSLAQTLLRRNARVLGTLIGSVIAALLLLSSSSTFIGFSFLVASGVAHAFFGVRYAVTAAAAAVMALTQVHLLEQAGPLIGFERLADTLAGAAFAWLAVYVLPIWERNQLPKTLREALEAIRIYAEVATNTDDSADLPRFTRQRAYDAIRAVEASRSRSLREPSEVRVPMAELIRWRAAAYALMSQLSNLRLTLTLRAGNPIDPAVSQSIAAASRDLDLVLSAYPRSPQQAPVLEQDLENAMGRVPDLLPRVQRTLHVAFELATESARIAALLEAPATS